MSAQPKPEAPLTAYDMADDYLRIHMPPCSEHRKFRITRRIYREIEKGTHYLKACHEALKKVDV